LMHGSLATRLRVLRAERGLTVRQVAEISGVAKETISQVERGERHPYDRTLAKLAYAYGVPVEDLLEEPEASTTGKASASRESGHTEVKGPLDGWINHALSEGDFARNFERAKGSQELADKLHRDKHEEAIELQQVVDTLREHNAPPAEILQAKRDLAVARAQLTAAAFLAVDLWRGLDVSGMDPRAIVADVIRNQRELLAWVDEGEPYPAQSGESA
jgi:transcriptional regulator with XRE-family HTH domain